MSPEREELEERLRALEGELAWDRRELRQLRRERLRAEAYALRSKQAILGTNRQLQDTVAELEAAMAELSAAKARAERASEAKGRFVATISHELRTPMNGIVGTADILAQSSLSPADRELVEIIQRSGTGLLAIISDVLDFTKAESGRIQLEEVPFDLHGCLRSIADLCLNAARLKSLVLEVKVAAGVPARVKGDPVRLRQVLLNLIDNAIKFTAEGSVTLEARPGADSDHVCIAVHDTGIGISAETQESIFEPFVQGDSSTTRRFGGSGLGLAICRHLVQLMGGQIAIESEVGQGTTFHFQARLVPAAVEEGDLARTGVMPSPLGALGLRVLAVDDNAVNRVIASRMLQRLGCRVETAGDGRAALERAAVEHFDAILMDCSMPEMDGFAATRAIRALPGPRAGVRIIAMTAHAMTGDRERCLAAGMDDYLAKPMRLAELAGALGRALRAAGTGR